MNNTMMHTLKNNYIYLATYNTKEEFYKKTNCILQGKKYDGFKYKKVFNFRINKT